MEASAVSVLLHVLWFLAVFGAVTLWGAAMSEIGDHLRQDTCTPARLACTAAAVSVVAAIAVAGASAVLPAPEGGSVPTGTAGGYRGEAGCTIATGPYVFSFAVERPSLQPSGCARKHA